MRRSRRVAAVFAWLSLAANADARSLQHLTRYLTPAETERAQKITESFVSAIVDAGHRAKHDCRVSNLSKFEGTPQTNRALAVAGGLAPLFPRVNVHCDEKPGDYSYPSLSLRVAVDPENRASLRPPKEIAHQQGLLQWKSDRGTSCLYLEAQPADAGPNFAALRIELDSGRPTGILEALTEDELAKLLKEVSVWPHARRPAVQSNPVEFSAAAEESKVVSAVLAAVAGKDAKAILRRNPDRKAVALDSSALRAIGEATPDLDPALLTSFVSRQQSGALPAAPPNVQVVDDDVVKAVFERGFWDEFHRRFPAAEGDLRLSPIAFGNGGSQAALTVGWQRGPLDGIGAFYVLQRDSAGAWAIIYEGILWLS